VTVHSLHMCTMPERKSRRLLTAVLTGALLPAVALTTTAHATLDLALPKPTGPHAVGAANLWLKDSSRTDPWDFTKPYRELMVTIWYPTDAKRGTRLQYMTADDSAAIVEGARLPAADPTIFSKVRTNALRDVIPAGRAHSLPLVFLDPAYSMPRMTNSVVAEDLASHGYVVAAIDHTGETYSTTFPDGHIAGCQVCGDSHPSGALLGIGALDVSFVLDELTARHSAWSGGELIDGTKVGISGHSLGGATALASMVHDPRIDAGVDMDGSTTTGGDPLVPAGSGFDRPFMVLSTDAPGLDSHLTDDYTNLVGWKRWMVMAGAEHKTFGDLALIVDWVGLPSSATIGTLRGLELTRRMNQAMFDKWLRGAPQSVLDDPTRCYPEITSA
jgi:predicted dienelactone hydrolase